MFLCPLAKVWPELVNRIGRRIPHAICVRLTLTTFSKISLAPRMIAIVGIAAGAAAPLGSETDGGVLPELEPDISTRPTPPLRKFGIVQRVRSLDVPCRRSGRELFRFEISSSPVS